MKWIFFLILLLPSAKTTFSQAISQKGKPFSYSSSPDSAGGLFKNNKIDILLSIIKGSADGAIIYSEEHKTNTDSNGIYHIDIGAGTPVTGQFDSIIWSDGILYLRTKVYQRDRNTDTITRNILMRISPDLSSDYEQGTVTASDHPDWGEWTFINNRGKRPRLITIDMSTSYANLAYPANTYPIFRHYEWCDPERNGTGNSFAVSYSENTHNSFIENTTKLGDIQLYAKAFQELTLSSTTNQIIVSITKPEPVPFHSETYAIKGPWKFIYYIEW